MSTDKLEISREGWDPDLYEVIAQTLERIRALERQGGSQGLIDWISKRRPAGETSTPLLKFAKSVPYTLQVSSSPAYDLIADIRTEDGYWIQYTRAIWPRTTVEHAGVINLNSWEEVTSAPNDFTYALGEGVVNMMIGEEKRLVAQLVMDPHYVADVLPGYPTGFQIRDSWTWHAPSS